MKRFRITVYETNSKGKEKITDCQLFDSRAEAEEFITNHKATPKPYKYKVKKPDYVMEKL